jgi:uncharacterized membrane protein YfcA
LSIEIILILFTVGIAAGFLSGMFGVGGGIVIVPALIYVYARTHLGFEYAVQAAIATSLFTIIFTSLSSAHRHWKNRNIVLSAALITGISSSVSVFFFSIVSLSLPQDALKKIFFVILIVVALKMLLDKRKSEEEPGNADSKNFNKIYCVAGGLFAGAIAALTGLGGGIFATLLLHYFLKFSLKRSIGTSTLAIMITSFAGVLSYYINMPAGVQFAPYSLGMSDVISALPIIAASVPSAMLGVYVHRRVNGFVLGKLFAVFIFIISIRLIFW